MTICSTGTLVTDAQRARTGLAAFNVITLEHAEAIIGGAQEAGRPVILQVSENVVRYRGGLAPLTAALTAMAEAARVPVGLHLDHVEDLDLLPAAVSTGYTSVMVDAGRLAYGENVATTAGAAAELHAHGLFVEAELGFVGGKVTQTVSAHAPGVRTDPAQAAVFVQATGVDSLAVAVGSSHAMTTRTASLNLELVAALKSSLAVPLVLHGSSGVPDDVLRAAVHAGITKVNIGTALNVAYTRAVRRELLSVDLVDPRRYLGAARREMTATVRHLVEVVSGPGRP